MNAGYVRLSRDDDRRNYVSIENQKLIIQQYASGQNLVIDCWYEDDGVSGYRFDRPGFNQLMEDLDHKLDRVFVKDFSRLGRHNAKVLLLLEEFRERGKQLVVIDDGYDSLQTEDDIIGIKTWYNERYVKETSKKIRSALQARQIEGTLLIRLPFGYRRNKEDGSIVEIEAAQAETVQKVFELYTGGLGYRRIANRLTEEGVPTPSMALGEREGREGKVSSRKIAFVWSESMVKDMLGNDFYTGVLRLHKRHRTSMHGKDRRVPRQEQYSFENHHPAIIEKADFERVQAMKSRRIRKRKHEGVQTAGIFTGLLFCKDCGSCLTPIRRKTKGGEYKYYICSRYNTKGKQGCLRSHLIREKELLEAMAVYLTCCMDVCREELQEWNRERLTVRYREVEEMREEAEGIIREQKKQLKVLLERRIREESEAVRSILTETYDTLEKKILARIREEEERLVRLGSPDGQTEAVRPAATQEEDRRVPPIQILEQVIQRKVLGHEDVALLVEQILVDGDGCPEIRLKYGFDPVWRGALEARMNRKLT